VHYRGAAGCRIQHQLVVDIYAAQHTGGPAKTGAEREIMIHRWMVAVRESRADRQAWAREITSSLLF